MRTKYILVLIITLLFAGVSQAQFTSTPNLGLKKPNSGLTSGWDGYLNGDWDIMDQGRPFSCASQAGATDDAKITNCLNVANTASTAGAIIDGTALTGFSWNKNPFQGLVAGTNMPQSGLLLLPCGITTLKYGPLVLPDWWSIKGCSPTFGNGGIGTHLQVSATTYPNGGTGQYSVGTVTIGTIGTGCTPVGTCAIVTGSGTNWTDNTNPGTPAGSGTIAPGCQFFAQATTAQPPTLTATYGIIKSITDTTHLILAAASSNNSGGAPGGSVYKIYCPAVVMGDASDAAAGNSNDYNIRVDDMEIDANGSAGVNTGVIPLVDWYGQQGARATNVSLRGACGVGLDLEGAFIYQSGPWDNIQVNPGSCNDGTSPDIVVRPNGASFFGMHSLGVYRSSATAQPVTGIDVAGYGTVEISGVDSEGPATAVTVGGAIACKPACIQPNRPGIQVVGNIDNVFNSIGTGSAVHLSNANGINPDVILSNINGSGSVNTLLDDNNGCTLSTSSESRLGSYQTDDNGVLNYSTSKVAGCHPPLPATYTFFCTGTATSSASIIPFPYNGSATPFPCTNTTTIGGSFPLANSCTLRNLQVHAGTGSFAGTDTVKVVNNGGSTTISATIPAGPGAQNGSDTTHTSAYTAGNGIRILITTGATDTLADVSGSFQCN